MNSSRKSTRALTAADVMSRTPVTVHHRTTLRAAVRVMARWRLHVLPVTDDQGRLVGVLTAAQMLRWALDGGSGSHGHDTSAWTDWQMMAPGAGRTDEVRWHLAGDTVVVAADARLGDLAQEMGNRGACCAVVIDGQRRPVGVLCGGDFMAASDPPSNEPDPRAARSGGVQPTVRRTPARPVG